MSEDFLSRWSRRKREATHEKPPGSPSLGSEAPPEVDPPEPAAGAEPEALSTEDVAKLPRLEDLTPETDLTVFLRRGVPEAIRNAALRRMWSLDPAIRDYVGDARDYAWDWNVPGGVPGTGALLPSEDGRALADRIVRGRESSPVEDPQPAALDEEPPREADRDLSAIDLRHELHQPSISPAGALDPTADAVQKSNDAPNPGLSEERSGSSGPADCAARDSDVTPLRRHGRAKPV